MDYRGAQLKYVMQLHDILQLRTSQQECRSILE